MIGPACPWCRCTEWSVEREDIVDRVITGYDPNNGPVYYARCDCCCAQGPLVSWASDAIPILAVRSREELLSFSEDD